MVFGTLGSGGGDVNDLVFSSSSSSSGRSYGNVNLLHKLEISK